VSYALELGKDNPSYMRSVLEATAQKNYSQLAQAFKMTCIQRFGVEKAARSARTTRSPSDRTPSRRCSRTSWRRSRRRARRPATGPLSI
jgi:hypothetical protein